MTQLPSSCFRAAQSAESQEWHPKFVLLWYWNKISSHASLLGVLAELQVHSWYSCIFDIAICDDPRHFCDIFFPSHPASYIFNFGIYLRISGVSNTRDVFRQSHQHFSGAFFVGQNGHWIDWKVSKQRSKSSWWFQRISRISVPRGKNKTCLKPPPSKYYLHMFWELI